MIDERAWEGEDLGRQSVERGGEVSANVTVRASPMRSDASSCRRAEVRLLGVWTGMQSATSHAALGPRRLGTGVDVSHGVWAEG